MAIGQARHLFWHTCHAGGILPGVRDEPPVARPPSPRQDALAVLLRLREAGHLAYFAGGCVRDQLWGIEPTDYDVATDATPQRVRQLFAHSQPVGAAFGVILVRRGGSTIEVATFRADAAYADGRRPSAVRFTTAQEDARRRDFTINGLFLDPVENRVIDYVGGQSDLADRRLRAIGDPEERFAEDYLRLLRAVRFAARFDLAVDAATATAIRRHAGSLVRISPERIADELRRMLTVPTRDAAWRLLWDYRLIDAVGRFLGAADGAGPEEDRSIFPALAPGRPIAFPLALAGLCVGVLQRRAAPADARQLLGDTSARHCARAMRQALRISNDEADDLRQIIAAPGPLLGERPPSLAQVKRFLAMRTSAGARELLRAFAATGHLVGRIGALEKTFADLVGVDCAPPPLLTGDALAAAGLRPGPAYKRLLDLVYDAQLEGRIATAAEALALALANA